MKNVVFKHKPERNFKGHVVVPKRYCSVRKDTLLWSCCVQAGCASEYCGLLRLPQGLTSGRLASKGLNSFECHWRCPLVWLFFVSVLNVALHGPWKKISLFLDIWNNFLQLSTFTFYYDARHIAGATWKRGAWSGLLLRWSTDHGVRYHEWQIPRVRGFQWQPVWNSSGHCSSSHRFRENVCPGC